MLCLTRPVPNTAFTCRTGRTPDSTPTDRENEHRRERELRFCGAAPPHRCHRSAIAANSPCFQPCARAAPSLRQLPPVLLPHPIGSGKAEITHRLSPQPPGVPKASAALPQPPPAPRAERCRCRPTRAALRGAGPPARPGPAPRAPWAQCKRRLDPASRGAGGGAAEGAGGESESVFLVTLGVGHPSPHTPCGEAHVGGGTSGEARPMGEQGAGLRRP